MSDKNTLDKVRRRALQHLSEQESTVRLCIKLSLLELQSELSGDEQSELAWEILSDLSALVDW